MMMTMQHGQHRHRAYQKLSTLQYVGHRNRKLAFSNVMWNKDLHNIYAYSGMCLNTFT